MEEAVLLQLFLSVLSKISTLKLILNNGKTIYRLKMAGQKSQGFVFAKALVDPHSMCAVPHYQTDRDPPVWCGT